MRVYLAGPMSGLPHLNHPAFHAAAAHLRANGLDVVNPAEIVKDIDADWLSCMRQDIPALVNCEALVLLPGWQDSRGAKIERAIAVGLGFPVWLYELESTIANATATLRRFQ